MNYPEVNNAVEHIKKTCKCAECGSAYKEEEINIVASTKNEGLFELKCTKCKLSTIITVLISEEIEIKEKNLLESSFKKTISQNDVLDIKNFLLDFDGNFKKIFNKVQ